MSYVLPIRVAEPRIDLASYLRSIATEVEVIVVDGSDHDVFEAHRAAFGEPLIQIPVDASRVTPMGKVGGVMTGVARASHDHVVIADDDVVYSLADLARIDGLLDDYDVVRPQNAFDPLPWHARWDTGRILLNRVTGGDWPGTMGVRRSTLLAAGGYAGDVLFENLELVRTIEAAGGRSIVALDLVVRRGPPTTQQFFDQRVRQAYDEFARPARLLVYLAILPFLALTRARGAAALAVSSVAAAEIGRRRRDGAQHFPRWGSLWAPLWLAERALTSWLAVATRVRHGGVRYRDGVLARAATPTPELRQRVGRTLLSSAAPRVPHRG